MSLATGTSRSILTALALGAGVAVASPATACLYTSAPEPVGPASAAFFASHMQNAASFVDIATAEETRPAESSDPSWRPQLTTFRVIRRLKGNSPDRFTLYVGRAEQQASDGPGPQHWVDEAGRVTPFPYPEESGPDQPGSYTSCHPGFLAVRPGRVYLVHREADGRLLGPVQLYETLRAPLFPLVEIDATDLWGWGYASARSHAKPQEQTVATPSTTVASVRFAQPLAAAAAKQWLRHAGVRPVAVRVGAGGFTDEARVPPGRADAALVDRALSDARENMATGAGQAYARHLLGSIDRETFLHPNGHSIRAWTWTVLDAQSRVRPSDAGFGVVSMEVVGSPAAIAGLSGRAEVADARTGFTYRGHLAAPTLVQNGAADPDTISTEASRETAASLLARLEALAAGRASPAPELELPPAPEPVPDCRRFGRDEAGQLSALPRLAGSGDWTLFGNPREVDCANEGDGAACRIAPGARVRVTTREWNGGFEIGPQPVTLRMNETNLSCQP